MSTQRRDERRTSRLRWVLFGSLAAALGTAVISAVIVRRGDKTTGSEAAAADVPATPALGPSARRTHPAQSPPVFQATPEVSKPAPASVSEEVRSRLVANAQQDLRKLEMQRPESFLKAVVSKDKDPELARAVYDKAGRYLAARTEALRSMTTAYINSFGDYDYQRDLAQLEEIDAAFKRDVAELKVKLPKIDQLADVMAKTALPVPTFARVDDRFRMSAAALAMSSAGQPAPTPNAAPPPSQEQSSPTETVEQTPSKLEDPK